MLCSSVLPFSTVVSCLMVVTSWPKHAVVKEDNKLFCICNNTCCNCISLHNRILSLCLFLSWLSWFFFMTLLPFPSVPLRNFISVTCNLLISLSYFPWIHMYILYSNTGMKYLQIIMVHVYDLFRFHISCMTFQNYLSVSLYIGQIF